MNRLNSNPLMLRLKKSNLAVGYAFIGLFIIGFLAFILFPILYSLYLAFTDYNILSPAKWVGLENFKKMFAEDPFFWKSFQVTLQFAVVQVPARLIFSLIVALALSKTTKMTGAYRVAYYIPSIVGGSVAIAMTWKQLWGNNGMVNRIIESLGGSPVRWLANESTAIYVLILLGVWQFGASMLIFLAGIKGVPESLHEAAIVDGAGPIKRFFNITLPMITPSIFFNLINGIIGSLQAFNSSYLITKGGPLNSTLYYGLKMYREAFEYYKMGYASAMSWFMFVVIVTLTAVVFRSSSWVFYQSEGK